MNANTLEITDSHAGLYRLDGTVNRPAGTVEVACWRGAAPPEAAPAPFNLVFLVHRLVVAARLISYVN
jgi:hypothetical protein